ncbi:hypothetical protein MRX96_017192 [Rhipicephalus microplus]
MAYLPQVSGMAMLLKTFVLTAYKAFQDGCLFYYFLQALQDELPWAKCYTWWGASPLNCVDRDVDLTVRGDVASILH